MERILSFLATVHDPRWRAVAVPDLELQAAIAQLSAEQSMNLRQTAQSYRRIKTTTKRKEQEFLEDLNELGWGF